MLAPRPQIATFPSKRAFAAWLVANDLAPLEKVAKWFTWADLSCDEGLTAEQIDSAVPGWIAVLGHVAGIVEAWDAEDAVTSTLAGSVPVQDEPASRLADVLPEAAPGDGGGREAR